MTVLAVDPSNNKAVSAVANYGWFMYKAVKPARDAPKTVVAVLHERQGQGVTRSGLLPRNFQAL